jgi:hypothetical protein
MMKTLPAAQRAAVERRASELIAEELSLRDLRKALNLTQTERGSPAVDTAGLREIPGR